MVEQEAVNFKVAGSNPAGGVFTSQINMLKKLKKKYKEILAMIVISFLVFWGFLIYLHFVGVPKTSARNYFNLAVLEFDRRNYSKSQDYLNTAKEFWKEAYMSDLQDKLDKVQL